MPRLSICIPTFNRAELLRSTLASVAGQLIPDVEVIISDNASTDHTSEVIAEFQQTYSNIKYYRSETNLGPDRNYLKVVSLATGEYCWLFGSDDLFPPDSIAVMLKLLSAEAAIYLLDRIECDLSMQPLVQREWLQSGPRTFDFTREEEILQYFRLARSLGAVFSYLSSIVVRRSAWNSIPYDERFTGTAYSHVFILLSLVNQGCTLTYAKAPLVLCRMGNDHFSKDGVIRRRLLDIDGYSLLANTIFKDRPAVRAALLDILLLREHPWTSFSLLANPKDETWHELKAKLHALGINAFKLKAAEWLAKATLVRDCLIICMRVLRKIYAGIRITAAKTQ